MTTLRPPRLTVVSAALAVLRRQVAPVTGLGWSVLAVGVGCWLLGWRCGWVELMLVATAAVLLLAACALLSLGRTRLRIEVVVEPRRVVVGGSLAGEVQVTNAGRGVLLPVALELPIGPGVARFSLPALRPRGRHDELFVVPTERRGVIAVGPATSVRGDPFGLIRRTIRWTTPIEVFVHPVTVPIEPLGAGLLRDLEGVSTNDLSVSDLAFHALREYTPGDDRRYIHWRSSAKAGRFLVRQFLDTRRSHLTVLVDSDTASYPNTGDYELAVSAAASVAVRSVLDGQELTVLAGEHAAPSAAGPRVLDVFSRAVLGTCGLDEMASRAVRNAPDTSIALLVTGSAVPFAELQRAAAQFAPEVNVLVLRADSAAPTSITGSRTLTVLTVQTLTELAALLAGALS